MVNSIAIEDPDEAAEEAACVGTDPALEVPSSDEEADDADRADFATYQIREPTLTRRQK